MTKDIDDAIQLIAKMATRKHEQYLAKPKPNWFVRLVRPVHEQELSEAAINRGYMEACNDVVRMLLTEYKDKQ